MREIKQRRSHCFHKNVKPRKWISSGESVGLRTFDFWGSMKHKHSTDSDICFPSRNSLYSLRYWESSPSAGFGNSVLVEAECVEENDLCQDIKRTL
ncbi:hypothetical protein CDAR_316801 [Caerostris darwini]|uniref:Uncharacterized protein n=1 Tax=Caerostris darwini TaxID=1538125 RepID=A0AAV4V7I2_9ARAC|nr:hypothetical protein CDAR_316801 [Caerostris darwini]